MNDFKASSSKNTQSRSTAKQAEDRELVRRVQSGDDRAFERLFQLYHRRAFAIAISVVKNEHDALEVVQEGFIKVHRYIGKFQGNSSFYTWLYRIIMNLSIDHIRKAKHRKGFQFDENLAKGVGASGDGGATVQSPTMGRVHASPSQSLDRRELGHQLMEALQALPEHHRLVLTLREVDGLSYEEISKVMEVPKGTVMSRLFHARRKMQELLEPYLAASPEVSGVSEVEGTEGAAFAGGVSSPAGGEK